LEYLNSLAAAALAMAILPSAEIARRASGLASRIEPKDCVAGFLLWLQESVIAPPPSDIIKGESGNWRQNLVPAADGPSLGISCFTPETQKTPPPVWRAALCGV
jgi:hypothetical protein